MSTLSFLFGLTGCKDELLAMAVEVESNPHIIRTFVTQNVLDVIADSKKKPAGITQRGRTFRVLQLLEGCVKKMSVTKYAELDIDPTVKEWIQTQIKTDNFFEGEVVVHEYNEKGGGQGLEHNVYHTRCTFMHRGLWNMFTDSGTTVNVYN